MSPSSVLFPPAKTVGVENHNNACFTTLSMVKVNTWGHTIELHVPTEKTLGIPLWLHTIY